MSTITVDPNTDMQTMRGWEGTAQFGQEFDFNPDAPAYPSTTFPNYKDALLAGCLDLGINRLRLEWRMDDINATGYTIDSPFPNAVQPTTATAGQIFFERIHRQMDDFVTEYRALLAAQGEDLFITICFVDFRSGGYDAETVPTEYAKCVELVVQDFYDTYGYLPDAIEPILEPENSGANSATWTPQNVANCIVAARAALVALDVGGAPGFGTIPFFAPSATSVANARSFIDDMQTENAAVTAIIDTYSYHRYGGSNTDVADVWTDANADGKETAMSEWIGANHVTLYDDITIGHVSTWQQFCVAFPWSGATDVGEVYFMVNTTTWAVTLSNRAKYLRHWFKYVRRGAVRKSVSNVGGAGLGVAFQNTNGTYAVVVKYTGSDSTVIAGLPAGTYAIRYTSGDGSSDPAVYDQTIADQTITAGQDVSFTMPGAGVATVYDVNYNVQTPTESLKRGALIVLFGR